MTTAPITIYLQWQEDGGAEQEITWCVDMIDDADVEYIRIDIHEATLAELEQSKQSIDFMIRAVKVFEAKSKLVDVTKTAALNDAIKEIEALQAENAELHAKLTKALNR